MTTPGITGSAAARPVRNESSERSALQIAHIIPYDGIGGVEIAAASVEAGRYPGFVFRKTFIVSKKHPQARPYTYESGLGPENNPLAFLRTVAHLLRERPQVLILSLWRSCIVGLIVKALRPRTRLVVFLHNVRHSNRLDAALTWLSARAAEAVWADSPSTAAQRLGPAWASRTRSISFLTTRMARVVHEQPQPRFITWGRLHPRKRIDLALDFFALVHARNPQSYFAIIGPDRGEGPLLKANVARLGLQDAVQFLGPADLAAIARQASACSFFVQTSRSEGMGMAVVEAMQLGLVPLVTPVGEIGKYVEDGRNGLWFDTPERARHKVEGLLADSHAFQTMSEAATRTWLGRPLYRDEFLAACAELASGPSPR